MFADIGVHTNGGVHVRYIDAGPEACFRSLVRRGVA